MLLAVGLSYLLGCLNAGYYVVRLRTGSDIRRQGSGNAGARNVGRVLGAAGFVTVFVLDSLKGAAALWLAGALGVGRGGLALAMLAVVLGHVFPVQLRFRGGKGVSTAFGALLVFAPPVAAAGLLSAGLLLLLTRRLTPAGLAGFALLPFLALALGHPTADIAAVGALSAVVLFAQRHDIAEVLHRPGVPAPGDPGP